MSAPKLSRYTTPLLPGQFSTETYFSSQPPPADLQARLRPVREFVGKWQAVEGKRVVVVTVSRSLSGGGEEALMLCRAGERRSHSKQTRMSLRPSSLFPNLDSSSP